MALLRQRGWFLARMLCVALAAWPLATRAGADEPIPREYRIKSVLLYHFTQFAEWPDSSFEDSTSPVVIGVLGKDPFGEALDRAVENEKWRGRKIVVSRYSKAEDATRCHILFISKSESERVRGILAALKGRPVLTVADFDAFLEQGGMISFFTNAEGKIRLRINLSAARAGGIALSSRLLRVAEIVTGRS
jgi:hypothetical protein